MTNEVRIMINMANSISIINCSIIERMDVQKVHMGKDGKFDYYILTVWYNDGKEITIREDCTIVER